MLPGIAASPRDSLHPQGRIPNVPMLTSCANRMPVISAAALAFVCNKAKLASSLNRYCEEPSCKHAERSA